ncbi:MAG: hypothetical protein KF708_04055 [Pirellulales bacterium]|nr:hypothetical protein [Pirellulales bacterium]
MSDFKQWIDESKAACEASGVFDQRRGIASVACRVLGDFDPIPATRLLGELEYIAEQLDNDVVRVKGHDPHISEDLRALECRINNPFVAAYWRASIDGKVYHACDNRIDLPPDELPGKYIDRQIPLLWARDCMLHTRKVARLFAGDRAQCEIVTRWAGLHKRTLIDRQTHSNNLGISNQHVAESEVIIVSTEEIADDISRVICELTASLYAAFGCRLSYDNIAYWIGERPTASPIQLPRQAPSSQVDLPG